MSLSPSRALPAAAPVGLVGAGTMGVGIAQVAAQAGHRVIWYDRTPEVARAGRDGIAAVLGKRVTRGKMAQADLDAVMARLHLVADLDALADCPLVIEAIIEDMDVKRTIFARLEAIVGDDAVLATNTSSLSITAIGGVLRRPERLVGLHFFNPAPLMTLVEVVSGLATAPGVADAMLETTAAWGKSPVHARSTPGFIVNRVARPFYAEALRVLQEGGAAPATLDAVMRESGGFRMGPFELMDLIGHDVNHAVTSSVFAAYDHDPRFRPSLIQRELVEAGWLGRKSGRGFYGYGPDAAAPHPETAESMPAPGAVAVEGDLGPAAALADLAEAAGLAMTRAPHAVTGPGDGCVRLDGGVVLCLTDGGLATATARAEDEAELIAFDLALDYASAPRVALAPADQASAEALRAAVGFFQALGKAVSVLDDVPGLIVFRTVCMLANEAADAVNQGVADPADVDTALRTGVNYPLGPLRWADALGLARVLGGLDRLAATYGEDRYRASPLLRRKVLGGTRFHG
ncbi:3-hydroxyacyl-CoA dehydrogenase [Roseospira visakhapatnamensis]|uniref:3-hydroxybutyryl-CoA dehydrogenase n=1 Tax=Roseospira visakhapatnamensis TaxID=390880 RepID=A0A7W6REE2_9PROT|nr:3-hydroxyacyl-CoA dehydrogenase [Roseospira visakhapatnamensis]MBB4267024.1 3-hydroxybutyryl-CoA dehydrogenase [Roseospira visakhapatnamensis]